MVVTISEDDVREIAAMPEIIAALRAAFLERAANGIKIVPRQRSDFWGSRLNVMAAGSQTMNRYVVKAYGNRGHHVLLYEGGKGLLAILEATLLSQIRTGAASAVATELMARSDAHRLAIIGAGRQALTQALAITHVREIIEIDVYSRTRETCANFCSDLEQRLAIPVNPAASAERAVRDADIIVTATTAATPVLETGWLAPGVHINAMGANAANRRELHAETVKSAAMLVVDDLDQARLEAGEFIDLAANGELKWADIIPLHDLVANPPAARANGVVTIFKSLGMALEDLAAASLVYDRWLDRQTARS